MNLKTFGLTNILLLVVCAMCVAQEPTKGTNEPPHFTDQIQLESDGKIVHVKVGENLFTTLDGKNYAKPIFYPVYAPGQIGMTRNWPMKDGVKGEAHDHPHHKSMWMSTELSGNDFWGEKGGSTKTLSVETGFEDGNAIRIKNEWVKKKDGKVLLTSQTTYRFGATNNSRWIDSVTDFVASHGKFQFDDTKEGLFAIRTHPDLRLTPKPKDGVHEVFGSAVNSEGDVGKDLWGKNAKWVLYQGPVDGKKVSVAIYDHPSNLRHPTTWHARTYGLVAANPFGLHHFQGKEKGEGSYELKKGETLSLRYRAEFFEGIVSPEDVNDRFTAFQAPVTDLPESK